MNKEWVFPFWKVPQEKRESLSGLLNLIEGGETNTGEEEMEQREVTLEEAKAWLTNLEAELWAEEWARAVEEASRRAKSGAEAWSEKDCLAFKAIHARLNAF